MYDQLREQLIKHEGLRLRPYLCTAGKLTLGVGRNLDDIGISKTEAMHMLDNDISRVVEETRKVFPVIEDIDMVRQDVLFNMSFNMGINRLKQFKKMWAAIEAHDWDGAAKEMLDSKWADQVKFRSIELARQMRTGEYDS